MKMHLIFLVLILCSCSKYKGDKDSINYDSIRIVFVGYGAYDTKEKITIFVTDSNEIKKLNNLKNESQSNWFANLKGSEYVARLLYSDSNTGEELIISISKSTNSTATIEYGFGTIFDGKYKNDKLVNYVSSIIKLDDIKQYKGSLSQEDYDKLM